MSAGFFREQRPAFAYAIPTFQNPTGCCYTAAERAALAEAACMESGVPMFEDDPTAIWCSTPATGVRVRRHRRQPVDLPGFVLQEPRAGPAAGFLAASPEFVPRCWCASSRLPTCTATGSASGWCSSSFEAAGRPARLARLADFYRAKRDAFDAALRRHFGALADWQTPAGGFVLLAAQAPAGYPFAAAVAIQRGVAFMPGEAFTPATPPRHPAPQPQPRGRRRDGHRPGQARRFSVAAALAALCLRAGHLAGSRTHASNSPVSCRPAPAPPAQGEAGVVACWRWPRPGRSRCAAQRRHQHQRTRTSSATRGRFTRCPRAVGVEAGHRVGQQAHAHHESCGRSAA